MNCKINQHFGICKTEETSHTHRCVNDVTNSRNYVTVLISKDWNFVLLSGILMKPDSDAE